MLETARRQAGCGEGRRRGGFENRNEIGRGLPHARATSAIARRTTNRRTAWPKLAAMTPNLKWDIYWKALDVPQIAGVIVGQPEFYERVNELIATVPMADWQNVPALASREQHRPRT